MAFRSRLALVCAALLAALLLASCGGSDGESDQEKAAAVARDYATAVAEKDAEGVCATLTSEAIQREATRFADAYAESGEGLPTCVKLYEFAFGLFGADKAAEAAAAAEEIDASDIELQGDTTAVLAVRGDVIVLKKSNGEWLINQPSRD